MDTEIKQQITQEVKEYLNNCGINYDVVQSNYKLLSNEEQSNFRNAFLDVVVALISEFETNVAEGEEFYIDFDRSLNIIILGPDDE